MGLANSTKKRRDSTDAGSKPKSPPRRRSHSEPNISEPQTVSYPTGGSNTPKPSQIDWQPNPRSPTRISECPKIAPPPPEKRNVNHYVKYPGQKVVVALYEYMPNTDGDLNFKVGDKFLVLKEEGDWFRAKNLSSEKEGYIPSNFVAEQKSLEVFDWYHGNIPRKRAEKDLHAPGHIRYTFLVRDSSSDGAPAYALSVLDEDEDHQKTVRHYRIRCMGDNKGFFLETKTTFPTLEMLVNHHREGSCSGESVKPILSRPCAKARPTLYQLSKDKWEISRGELDFEQLLGSGKFGEVHQGRWRNKCVAIKTLKEGSMDPAKFLDEAAIMKQLRHRKLVALYAVCTAQEPFYIVAELLINGCLLNYLKKDGGKQIRLPNLIDIAGQVADGMMFLESKEFIHRDLAARNILVGELNQVKIGDFGLALAARDAGNVDKAEKFPIKWTAPEAMRGCRFTIKSDVWSFGVLLVELMTYGETPYPALSNKDTMQFVEKGGRHPRPTDCPQTVYDIMLSCWKPIPEQRPTFESLYGTFEDYAIGDPNVQYQ